MTRGQRNAIIAAIISLAVLTGCAGEPRSEDVTGGPSASPTVSSHPIDVSAELQQLESHYAARIGVSALDTGTGQIVSYRADERFGYASTIKAFAAAAFFAYVPVSERETLETWTEADVDSAGHSPVTSQHIDDGLTFSQLAEAAVRNSDNTALNLVFARVGGPSGVAEFLKTLGDVTSDVTNYEPQLNIVEPGSTANTTTASSFTADLQTLVAGNVLDEADLATLIEWMTDNRTGDALIRAGAPDGWIVADKSGGAGGIRNDVAIVTPPGRDVILLTILTEKNSPDAPYDDAAVADAARVALAALN